MEFSNHADLPTLYEALTTANRPLHDEHMGAKSKVDKRTNYLDFPMSVVHWNDFDIKPLTQAYGDTLSLSLGIQIGDSNPKPKRFSGLGKLKLACQKYFLKSVHQALVKGTNDISRQLLQATPNVEIILDDRIQSDGGYSSGLSLKSNDAASASTTPASLVVSCFYRASTWRSSNLQQNDTLSLIPFSRLARYCLDSKTRYGFIFTNEELVVARVSATKSPQYGVSCQVEWQSIPLSNSGPGVLTAKLSLWFLTMMSLHAGHRIICAPEQLLSVNRWWRHRDCNLRVVFQHHLSMRLVAEEPADADVEDMNLIL